MPCIMFADNYIIRKTTFQTKINEEYIWKLIFSEKNPKDVVADGTIDFMW